MRKVLGFMGVAFLAQIIFVGMIHFLLAIQGTGNPETLRSLSEMPVIGGFFFPPPVVEEPLDPELEAERRARMRLEEAKRFFPPPTAMKSEELDKLRNELAAERERYLRRLEELEERELAVQRSEEETKTEWGRLEDALAKVQERADELDARRRELEQRLIRISEDERENLKRFVGMLGNMEPQAAAQMIEGTGEGEEERGLDVTWAAKIMIQLEQRQSAKIMNAMGQAARLRLFNAMSSITSGPVASDTENR